MKKVMFMAFIFLFITGINAQKRVPDVKKNIQERTVLSVTNMDGTTTTSSDLAQNILGPGISYSNISFTGLSATQASAGLFSGGLLAGLGFESGIILSSGYVNNAVGPNSSGAISANLNLSGDIDLNGLIPGSTNDATVLEFDFTLPADSIFIEFIFASEEYNEWVNSSYNDVFAFFLDGVNIALIPGTSTAVSVNNVNNGLNSGYYIDNTSGTYNVECDGFTTSISGTFALNNNPNHHIKLAIADAGDHALDSWVFIRESSFSIPIEVDLGDDFDLCLGESAVLDAGNAGYEFLWSTGETTQTITVDTEGLYSVDVSFLGNTESDEIYVTVNPLPVADAGFDALIYIGYPPLETQLSASGGVQYNWTPTAGLDDPNISDPVAQPSSSTIYTVLVTDANGCVDTDEVLVDVMDVRCGKKLNKVLLCHMPPGNTFNCFTICVSPNAVEAHLQNGDYLGGCIVTGTGSKSASIMGIDNYQWSIYPNPVSDQASINLSRLYEQEVELTIYDITGKIFWKYPKSTLNSTVIVVDTKEMPSGVYNVVLQTNEQSLVRKLVITR